jgi:predicted ATPase
MFVTHAELKNWRNFRKVDIALHAPTYIIGPNASGKSNLLDVFRFLRDICKPAGGGLAKAVEVRGGITKVRCLYARRDPEIRIHLDLKASMEDAEPTWRYVLGFKSEGKGKQRPVVSVEQVWRRGQKAPIVDRPDPDDQRDPVRLTQTYLEQINANGDFREVADFFASTTYLHLVPQLLKFASQIGGNVMEDDPFGQGFLKRLAKATPRARDSRIKNIGKALRLAVPRFEELRFLKDQHTGEPHIEARYEHYRPNAGWQREDQFSDGTLRLLALLWSLYEGDSLLLMEEPELSLNNAIIEQLPAIMQRIQRTAKYRRQVLVSTHSEAMLSNPGINGLGVLLLEPGNEGTEVRHATEAELAMLSTGLSVAEVLLPKTRPERADRLGLLE